MTDLKPVIDYLTYNALFFLVHEPMNRHTTFQIGGPADLVAYPTRRRELCDLMKICKAREIPLTVLGNGSNVLVGDAGIRGLTLMTDRLHRITVGADSSIEAWAGASLSHLCSIAKNYSLSGLEFAFGIPGSVGGAVVMNAGAYGGAMKDVTVSTEYVSEQGELCVARGEEQGFGYRTSAFQGNSRIVIRSTFSLTPADGDAVTAKMKEYAAARREKQPLELPSAGSAFKRPENNFAGKLIEEAGLKGAHVGGAFVSEKHAGFIVNKGGASAADVLKLMELVRDTVYRRTGIALEAEIKKVGV